jgi:hypothetical protein
LPAAGDGPALTGVTPGDGIYTPLGNVALYQLISRDVQEIGQLTNAVNEGRPLPGEEILGLYERAKNARVGTASRPIRAFARAEARGREFPEAAQFYGKSTFLDDTVNEAIQGTESAANLSPAQRRQVIQKGMQRILAYWMRQGLLATEPRIRDGLLDPAVGAPHNVDEVWALYMGAPQGAIFPIGLSATAVAREQNFRRDGTVDRPLRMALQRAQQAAVAGNLAEFQSARREVEGRLNAIFYLAAANYLNESLKAAQAGNAANATVVQAEGLSYYQTIQPTVAGVDAEGDRMVVSYFQAAPTSLTAASRDQALAAMNRALDALGLQAADQVTPASYQ